MMNWLPPFRIRDFSYSLGSALEISTRSQDDSNQGKHFRLLCLDDLSLQSFELGASPPYLAVSHVWAESVFVDLPHFDSSLGGRAVRKALSERFPALKYCWVDNFCILQDNENDKFEQIPLMGDIYHNADGVLIIHDCELGLTQDELDEALSGLEEALELWRLRTLYYTEQCQPWRDGNGYTKIVRAMKALARFTRSDWCTRVWTLQEFIFAQTIVWIGDDLIPLACDETFFAAIPSLCNQLFLKEMGATLTDSEFVRLQRLFIGMADMRMAGHEPTRVMEIAADRSSSIPVDEIYGAMAASGVAITPLPDETIDEAWSRWCEAAVSRGHIRWLMLPPTPSLFPDVTQGNCLFPRACTRAGASYSSLLDTVVPYAAPSISDGTVKIAAKFAGRCRLIRKLDPIHRNGGLIFPRLSLILFSRADWSLAAHIAESFSSGQFPTNEIHAIAKVFTNSYDSALRSFNENKSAQFIPVMSSPLEKEAYLAFSEYVSVAVIPVFSGAIAYLALLEAEELQLFYPVAVALGDREPTGLLVAFDVNATTREKGSIFLIAEAGKEDAQRELQDPDFDMGDFIFHKVGVTGPIMRASVSGPFREIKIGGSHCPVCGSKGQ